MPFFSTLKELLGNLIRPYLFICAAMRFLPGTILELIGNADFRALFSPSTFRDIWFSNFWEFMGPQRKANAEKLVVSLLKGRVQNGEVANGAVSEPLSGVCLEIGAGTGLWADVFAKTNTDGNCEGFSNSEVRRRKENDGVTRVYGIEPNPKSAAALRKRVEEIGLAGIYEVVPVGIESLYDPTAWNCRIESESVDCIVSILCLCSIPEPENNIRLLYNTLKKGGRWYALEHIRVRREKGLFLYAFQCELGDDPIKKPSY